MLTLFLKTGISLLQHPGQYTFLSRLAGKNYNVNIYSDWYQLLSLDLMQIFNKMLLGSQMSLTFQFYTANIEELLTSDLILDWDDKVDHRCIENKMPQTNTYNRPRPHLNHLLPCTKQWAFPSGYDIITESSIPVSALGRITRCTYCTVLHVLGPAIWCVVVNRGGVGGHLGLGEICIQAFFKTIHLMYEMGQGCLSPIILSLCWD